MLRKTLLFTLCLAIGVTLGTLTAFRTILDGLPSHTFTHGPWKTWHSIGKPTVDPYSQAKMIIYRWFPISSFETLYFIAENDSGGEILQPDCTYRVSGQDLKSSRWSISIYQKDEDERTMSDHKFSVNSENILRDHAGNWHIEISPTTRSGNVIQNPAKASYQLFLRLYSYEQDKLDENFGPLPAINKVSCS